MNLEYELTSLSFAGNRPKNGTPGYGDHQQVIEAIKQYGGSTLRDKFDTYWTQEVGITLDEIKEFRSIMLEPTESITIGNTNIATYYSPNALDFTWTKDMKAYIVSTFNPETGQVTLTRVNEVPAETGIIVKGQAGTFNIPIGESNLFVANLLKGVTTPTVMNKEEGEVRIPD